MKYYIEFYSTNAGFMVEAETKEEALIKAKQMLMAAADRDIAEEAVAIEIQETP